jgi:UDP-N-acetylglucosamine--N-acetylmuramyl-(pentapeptide) pyrophosphoryl-undecaprenol N-acetylglucosamine transferase
VVAEAALRGIPTVAVEMDSHMGWTNTILSKLVDRVCLSYPDEGRRGSKFVYTGRPLRPALLRATREQGLERFGLDHERPVLLVFGGSLGAHVVNEAVLDAFALRSTPFQIVHVTGERDFAWARERLAAKGANVSYQVHAFLDDLPLALAAADAVVARAGGSVAEILARGVPALLVPYPFAAGDHQAKNASRMAETGAALVIENADLDAKKLSEAVSKLLRPDVNKSMREAALGLAVPDAADRIADVVVELLTRHAG